MKKTLLILLLSVLVLSTVGCTRKIRFAQVQTNRIEENHSTDQIAEDTKAPNPETLPPETLPPETADYKTEIIGGWISARREGNVLYFSTLTFNEDGTFTSYPTELHHVSYDPFPDQVGWFVPGMGFPGSYGTYSVDGATLTKTHIGDDIMEYDPPYTVTRIISSIKDGKLTLDDSYGTYAKIDQFIDNYAVDYSAVCDYLGVDTSVG